MSTLDNDQIPVQDELAALKARADQIGLSYHPSIGLEKLREKVNAALAATADDTNAQATDPDQADPAPAAVVAAVAEAAPVVETEGQRRKRLRMEAAKLVRIRVTCMNPAKKDWEGEIFTVGNAAVGTFKKYVPFNTDEGWHVPNIIYKQIKDRMCQIFVNGKTANGVTMRQGKTIREFAVEILPDLTPDELKDLAQRQAMAAGGS